MLPQLALEPHLLYLPAGQQHGQRPPVRLHLGATTIFFLLVLGLDRFCPFLLPFWTALETTF